MLGIEMLQARFGDALWLEYGDARHPHVVIIDCGFKENYRELKERIARLEPDQLELLVLTHVDDDHIRGAVPLLADRSVRFAESMEVWFNGWRHLNAEHADELSAVQGEMFAALISQRELRWNALAPWNGAGLVVPDHGPLPAGSLPGGLKWTLLSPSPAKLRSMRELWKTKVEAQNLVPGDEEAFLELLEERSDLQPDELGGEALDIEELAGADFEEDDKEPNGSSIALLIEHEGHSLLLTGDAHPRLLATSLQRLAQERGVTRIPVDLFKVSHHGSRRNTSAELLEAVDCRRFLFSSSGDKHGHPSPECVARIIQAFPGATLHFNYRSDVTSIWGRRDLQEEYRYEALYPDAGSLRWVLE
jgi:Metallo-beta-lactamase superfamily